MRCVQLYHAEERMIHNLCINKNNNIVAISNFQTFISGIKDIGLIYWSRMWFLSIYTCQDFKMWIFTWDVVELNRKMLQLRTISDGCKNWT